MPNYQIIQQETDLIEFIETILPATNGFFYVSLLARKKWCEDAGLKADKSQLKRLTSKKAMLVDKIRQLEIAQGAYKIDGLVVPQEALGLYITPNERNNKAATFDLIQTLLSKIQHDQFEFNLHQEALSCLQKSGVKTYFDLDIDFEDRDKIDLSIGDNLCTVVNKTALTIIRTRGGFHVLVELDKIASPFKKSWYNAVQKVVPAGCTVTMNGDNLIPVVGCCQGGFTPYMVKLSH